MPKCVDYVLSILDSKTKVDISESYSCAYRNKRNNKIIDNYNGRYSYNI